MARLVVEGAAAVELDPATPCVAGRLQSCALRLAGEVQASRQHFELFLRGTRWIVRDLGSRNGTLLNGVRVRREAPLTHGDRLGVGETTIVFSSAPPPLPAGAEAAGCRVLSPAGRARTGALYRARQLRLDREVELLLVDPDLSGDPDFAEAFRRAVRCAGSFDHPRLQAVYDSGRDGSCLYAVRELLCGRTLAEAMERAAFERERAWRIVAEVAEALAHVHARDLCHGSLTPACVALTAAGAKLCGPAEEERLAPHRPDRALQANFASPEEARGEPAGPAADLYSLGVVAYRLLSGELPFRGTPREVLAHHARDPAPLPSGLAGAGAALLSELLSKAAGARPPAAEVAERARALAGGASAPRPPARRRPQGRKASGRARQASGRARQASSADSSGSHRALAARRPGDGARTHGSSARRAALAGSAARRGPSARLRASGRALVPAPPDPAPVLALRLSLLALGYTALAAAGWLAARIALRALQGS